LADVLPSEAFIERSIVRERDFQGLKHVRDQLGSRLRAGIVVYTGQRTLPFGDRLFAVPLEGLWR
jgi:uncharacterized protein